MSPARPTPSRRYRRRILGVGVLAFVSLFALGASIFVPVVQNDLEDRVEAAMAENGIDGVTASFSGQDGTLYCAQPLDEPDAVRRLGEALWGVRVIGLDRTCVDDQAPGSGLATDTELETATTIEASSTSVPGTAPTGSGSVPASTEPDDMDSIVTLVSGDPLFSQLGELIEVAGLDGPDELGGDGPFTFLAPTDAAFDAAFDQLGADDYGALVTNPELLRTVLLHHIVAGRILSTDFAAGPIEMLDGTQVTVDPASLTFTSGDSVAVVTDRSTQVDIEASNGVVHAIDRLLIPPGLDLDVTAASATTTIELVDGRIVLSGVVADAGQSARLLAAAGAVVDPANVEDRIDPVGGAAIADVDIDRLVTLVAAMPTNLVSGTATLHGSDVALDGIVRGDDAANALALVAEQTSSELVLSPIEQADAASALALQNELNDFIGGNPIVFEPDSTALSPEANGVIEQLGARASRLAGVAITIIGHTDSDGSPTTNQLLSEGRAASVREALIAQGIAGDELTSQGRGETSPIVDGAGVEDKAASRRVEFVVEVR